MAYINRKYPQFPTSSISRMMSLAKGMVGNIVNEHNWVQNVFLMSLDISVVFGQISMAEIIWDAGYS